MTFRQKVAILTFVALGASAAPPSVATKWQAIPPAYAQRAAATYDPGSSPFEAGSGIKAIANKARAGTKLETAKKLHSILQVGEPGGLKAAEAGKTIKDDRPPNTAEEALKRGGDCSEFAYVVLAAAKELGIAAGTITLDIGGDIMHLLPVVEIDGKKYILDPQTGEFGKGTVEIGSKRITFTYESLGTGKPKLLWESTSGQSVGSYHMEWGNYLKHFKKDEKKLRQAVTAFRKAMELNPADTHLRGKMDDASAALVNILMRKAEEAFGKQEWKSAASLFEEAIEHVPSTMSKANQGSLHENAAACLSNSGEYAKAAEHYDAAYGLTGKEEYKKSAVEAREKAK